MAARRESPHPASAIPASSLLLTALVGAVGGAALLLVERRVPAGLAALAGAVALVSALALARAGALRGAGRAAEGPRPRLRLAANFVDVVFDAALLAALAWTAGDGDPAVSGLAIVALGGSLIAAYERARARSLGYRIGEGLAYRTARASLLVAAFLLPWTEALLGALAAVTLAAAAVRGWTVARQERRARAVAGT